MEKSRQIVRLETSLGNLDIELYWDHAPRCSRNFATLAERGYFDNCKFHRIIPNFIVQTGDPSGTGKGGTSIYGPRFEDEIHPGLKHTGAGVVSMANSGPNTNGSQFTITLAPTPSLDGKQSIFGRVSQGIKHLAKMNLIVTDKQERPLQDIYVIKAYLVSEETGSLIQS